MFTPDPVYFSQRTCWSCCVCMRVLTMKTQWRQLPGSNHRVCLNVLSLDLCVILTLIFTLVSTLLRHWVCLKKGVPPKFMAFLVSNWFGETDFYHINIYIYIYQLSHQLSPLYPITRGIMGACIYIYIYIINICVYLRRGFLKWWYHKSSKSS